MSENYPASYYQATLNYSLEANSLKDNVEVETCIIGGGYAGLMTALGLLEKGHKSVALLEQNQIGWGASGRNGGFVFGGYSLGARQLVNQVGDVQAKDLYQLTTDAVDLIRGRISRYKIQCDVVDEGVIWANWFNDQKLLYHEQKFMQEKMGVNWAYLDPEQLSEKILSDRYHGGLFEPNAMHFHPLNYALGTADVILKKGGQIFENSKVLSIDYKSAEKQVVTQNGSIKCKNLVIAAGGYIESLCRPVSRSILPIATYVMATEPLGEDLSCYLKTKSAVYDTRFAFDYYRPLNDSRILWGGRISASKNTPSSLEHLLRKDIAKVFPELSDVKIDYVWDGWMAYSRHQMAQIGQIAPNVWYGIGFGGHGVAPTTVAGEVISAAIAKGDTSYQKFQPWGLPWNGWKFGVAAAQLSYWWYELKDWLKEQKN